MDTEKLIIIGRSPIINDELLEIASQSKGVKVSLNHYLSFVDYLASVDFYKGYYGQTIPLTLSSFNIKGSESYNIKTGGVPFWDARTKTLKYCGFTHDFVLSWAKMKGFKNVILLGVADFIGYGHYNNNQPFNPSPICIEDSLKYIDSLQSDDFKIATINKESKLNVKRITTEEFKKWH